MYALIDSNGNILRKQTFDGAAPVLANAKGLRWVTDVQPDFDSELQTCIPSIPVTGDSIEYVVSQISQAEIADKNNQSINNQIGSMEKATLLPRVTREFMLAAFAAQAAAAGIDPMTNVGYARMKALDEEIAALRRKLI